MPSPRSFLLASLVAFLALTTPAGAATLEVCPAGCPFTSIQSAVTAASPGDTVNVAAGTYAEPQILINKPLTLQGAGPGQSIIDGGKAALPTAGTVRVETNAGNVTVDGFTVRNAGTAGAVTAALVEKATAAGPTFTFSRLTVEGLATAGTADQGLYSFNSSADLVLAESSIFQTGGNPVLIEQHRGATDIRQNSISPFSPAAGSAIFIFTYGGADVVARQRVRDNSLTGAGVTISAAFQNITGLGRFTAPEVTDNDIFGLVVGSGVTIQNGDTDLGGAEGRIKDAIVTGNDIRGGTGSVNGVRLSGAIEGTTVSGNSITGVPRGIRVQPNAGGAATGSLIRSNRIVGNATGVQNDGVAVVDATNNWWGCNEGPGASGCDTVTGPVDFDPWLVLGLSASPTSIKTGGDASDLEAFMTRNSDGQSGVGAGFPDGYPVTFATSLGSISPAGPQGLNDRRALAQLVSGAQTGTATVSAAYDNETVTTPVAITPACPATGGDLDGDGAGDACDTDDDADGLDDTTETQIGTDPRKADSDGDSVGDKGDACPTISGSQANGCPATTTTGGDDRPPAVTLTSPQENAVLGTTASTPVRAQASDDRGVAAVRFLAGSRVVCTDTVAPYECAYQPTGADVGRVLMLAVAIDTAGQVGLAAREVVVGRFTPGPLTSSTTPSRDRTRPYTFTTTGRLTLPANVAAAQGCAGEVSVQFKTGTRTISNRRARVGADCRYRSSVTFRARRSLTTLRVRARFHGSRVLAPRVGAFRTVRIG